MGKYGKVTGFKAYIREVNSRKSVTFQLWKPADLINHNYELVTEYSFTVNGEGLNEVQSPESKPFSVFSMKDGKQSSFRGIGILLRPGAN